MKRRWSVVAVLALLAACGREPGTAALDFKSVDITGAEYARQLSLPSTAGGQFNLAEQTGRISLVFFGYTQCPDVCPTLLSELAAVKNQLGADGARIQGVFVSVDPERDTLPVLKAYVGNFGPGFVGLTGTEDQVKAAAKEFKVFYGKVPGKTEGSYTVDHTAGTFVFDAKARVRLFVRYGAPTEALVHDLKLLLAQPAA